MAYDKYRRLQESKRLLLGMEKFDRHQECSIVPHGPIKVLDYGNGKNGLTGYNTCAKFWTCPVCSTSRAYKDLMEFKGYCDHWLKQGKAISFSVLTVPHRFSILADLITPTMSAFHSDNRDGIKHYNELIKKKKVVGHLRITELDYLESSGFHPHHNWLIFHDLSPSELDDEVDEIQTLIRSFWSESLQRVSLPAPHPDHGVIVTPVYDSQIAAYSLKGFFGSSDNKKPDTYTSMDFLDRSIDGDKKAGYLFQQFAKATDGHPIKAPSRTQKSKLLAKKLGLGAAPEKPKPVERHTLTREEAQAVKLYDLTGALKKLGPTDDVQAFLAPYVQKLLGHPSYQTREAAPWRFVDVLDDDDLTLE